MARKQRDQIFLLFSLLFQIVCYNYNMKTKIIKSIKSNIKALRQAQKLSKSWVEIEAFDFAILQLECQIAEINFI